MKKLLFITAAVMLFSFSFPPLYAKKKTVNSEPQQQSVEREETVALKLPPRKSSSPFASISQNVVSEAENGSPQSLKNVVSILKKDNASYTDGELILANVCVSLLNLVWPSENFIAEVPPVKESNAYTGAIDSARQGVYDFSTGNTDFLTIVLPSVVLVTSESRNDYYEDSYGALTQALAQKKDSVLANYLMGVLLRRQEKYGESVEYLELAYRNTENNLECGTALIRSRLKLNQKEKAYDLAKELLAVYPMNKQLLKLISETAYVNGDLVNAEQFVARVLQQEPDNASFILFRAKILVYKGEYIKAASLLDVYARTDNINRDYLVLRAKVQKDWNRNLTAATQTFEEALKLYPDDKEIILAAAELSSETGTKISGFNASQLVSQILQQEPENVEALQIQIAEMVKNKDWNNAYKSSSNLLKLKDYPENAVYTHIEICISSGRKDEAMKKASEQYSAKPNDENAIQSYVAVLVATGKTAEANRIISQKMNGFSNKLKSVLYYQKSFLEKSEDQILANLRQSLTANPRNKDSLYRLYQIYYNKKEYRKAQYYLKQVVANSPNDESLLAKDKELTQLLDR